MLTGGVGELPKPHAETISPAKKTLATDVRFVMRIPMCLSILDHSRALLSGKVPELRIGLHGESVVSKHG